MRGPLKQNSKKQRRFRIVAISLVLVLIGLLIPKIVSLVSAAIVYPIHTTSKWINHSSSLVPSFIRSRLELNQKIEDLENELVIAQNTSLTRQRLIEENNMLRQMLSADGEARIAAAVIARPNELPYDLLQIDRGSNHGIEVDTPVYIGEDVVVGLVAHVATEYSFVELITTNGFEASAFISGPNVAVTMEGVGGGVARVKVPQGIPLKVGNLVYLPSVEPGVFGRISHIENRPTQPEQYGYITPDISMASLHLVSVGRLSQISRSTEEVDSQILELMKSQLTVPDITVGVLESETESATNTESEI